MINHARTLLLNRPGNNRPDPLYFLEEFVDSAFIPAKLSGVLKQLADILVDPDSDNAFANFRLWQYMKILHSTEFAAYVTNLDPRITYLTDRSVASSQEATSFTAANPQASGVQLYFSGQVEPSSPAPRLFRSWEIEIITPLFVRSTSLQEFSVRDTTVTVSGGLSSEIPMAGQNDFFARIVSDPLPIGAKWLVETFARPSGDLTDLLAPLEDVVSSNGVFLFTRQEPFKTFGDLWKKHNILAYRMSGLLLAHIYQVEKVRTNG